MHAYAYAHTYYDKQVASSFLPESNNPHEQGCFETQQNTGTSSVHTFTLLLHSTHSASKQRAVRLHFLQIAISISLDILHEGGSSFFAEQVFRHRFS